MGGLDMGLRGPPKPTSIEGPAAYEAGSTRGRHVELMPEEHLLLNDVAGLRLSGLVTGLVGFI